MGLFIPLPVHLAKKFPTLIPDDHSPSHVTLLYIGEVTEPEEQERLVETLREVCAKWYWTDAKATLGDLSTFDHGERVVPHLQVDFSRDFASFRRLIKQELQRAGFPCDDKYVEYKPHVTLDYLPPDEEWAGKKPKGSWTFDKIEVWGLPDVVPKIQLGRPKVAYGGRQGMSDRIRHLNRRLARLVAANSGDPRFFYLPEGAQFVWDSLVRIQEILDRHSASSQLVEFARIVDRAQSEMLAREAALQNHVRRAQDTYLKEMGESLNAGLGLVETLIKKGVYMNDVRDLLKRMRDTL